MRINFIWISICLLLMSCSGGYDGDCSTGACCCSDKTLENIEPSDSNYFPKKIRQQFYFTSNTDTTLFKCYTEGIVKTPYLIKVGTKAEQVNCGTDYCNYLVNIIPQSIVYNSTQNIEIIKIVRQPIVSLKYASIYSYNYTVSEYSFINILGTKFYFKGSNFEANDSNKITFNSAIDIENSSYSDVYVLEKDTFDVSKNQPYKCYYSIKNDGLIGFKMKNGNVFIRQD